MSEPTALRPHWPEGLEVRHSYQVPCDDKGHSGGTWMRVMVDDQGDAYVKMQEWENIPEGEPKRIPSIRIRTRAGGGKYTRTRQALLWLADAIRRDRIELGIDDKT